MVSVGAPQARWLVTDRRNVIALAAASLLASSIGVSRGNAQTYPNRVIKLIVTYGPTVQVNSGDIVFADETGIVVIPAAQKAAVLLKANEIREAEDSKRAHIP